MARPRRITKKRFMYLCNAIGLLDSIIHNLWPKDDKFTDECHVYDDELLTKEISDLKTYIIGFEKRTGIKLRVDIGYCDNNKEDADGNEI